MTHSSPTRRYSALSIVDSAFSDIEPTKATIYLTLKKGHEQSSVDWEREMAPKLQHIADARVNFQSQSGGGFGRDITIMLGSDDPELLRSEEHTSELQSLMRNSYAVF